MLLSNIHSVVTKQNPVFEENNTPLIIIISTYMSFHHIMFKESTNS